MRRSPRRATALRSILQTSDTQRGSPVPETKAYEPTFMPVGVLTAALQELTPREERDADPDLAVEQWLAFASDLGADCIELSAAPHPPGADLPAQARPRPGP